MRVVAVAQAFKGSLPASAVARAAADGLESTGVRFTVLSGSDGGDGLLDAIGPTAQRRTVHRATDAWGREVEAHAVWLDPREAVIESREVCGFGGLAVAQRDPLRGTTRGVGELIAAVARAGARRIVVGLGGSATVDGGVGMARFWGWRPTGLDGRELPEGGGALEDLGALHAGVPPSVALMALCDVRHPLTGDDGAVVFAPQKGASPEAVVRLRAGLDRLAVVTEEDGPDGLARARGAGAAGGLGFGLAKFGRATLVEGAPWVLDRLAFDARLAQADAVLVCEAAFDETSLRGKLTGTVLERAQSRAVPAILVAPHASHVPTGVQVETGGGEWTAEELARRVARAVAGRLLGC